MKRSGAIWLVAGVIAVAAALMYFVVMPQIREGRTVEDIAKQAEQTVKEAVNDAARQVEDVADGVEEIKATALVRMARLGQDAKAAADEFQAVLDKAAPTPQEIDAAKTKLRSALLGMSELQLPAGTDGTVKAAASKLTDGAKAALAALDTLPADPAAAKAALAEIKAKLLAALPEGEVFNPAALTQPAATDDSAAATKAASEEPRADAAADTEKPAETATATTPAFDILRVEKDGSTVIAGRAEPGARIEIVNGDKVIASTDADTSGDFAAVLDDPLTAGDHSITLKATTKDGKSSVSEEVATVSVPKDASGELLAMVTRPGQASKIITMPEDKAEDKASETASDKSMVPDAATQTGADTAAAAQETEAGTQDVAKADGSTTEDAAKPAVDAASDIAAATPDLPAESADIAATPPVVAEHAATSGSDEQQVATADPSPADAATAKPADAAQQADKAPAAMPEVLVSAVELEGDRIFIAGNARPGATVRLYADDRIVAEAKADNGGRFVADGTIKLAVGNHTIRADVLSANGAKVEFRASVPFFRPEGDLAAVASADGAKDAPAIEPLANGAFDKARQEAGKAVALLKGLYAGNRTPTAEELAAARSSAEIALKSLADIRIAADVDPTLAEMAAKASEEAAKALDRLKAVPADVAAFKSALGEVETIVASAVKPAARVAKADDAANATKAETELAADPTQPAGDQQNGNIVDKAEAEVSADDVQVTAKVDRLAASADQPKPSDDAGHDTAPAGNADAAGDRTGEQQAAADQPKVIEQAPLTQSESSVIIRRGDTLWQISRRVYGKGVRYTTIYIANKAQIEDPDRIMPGQIFTMPGKWLENAEELHKERLEHDHR
jgi:nucleoid-associated protein YgaU